MFKVAYAGNNRGEKRLIATAVALLMVTLALTLVALPVVHAHWPSWTMQTYSYVTAAPNPVGVGQPTVIIFWSSPNPPTAQGLGGDRWLHMMLTITKPDGTTQTLGPFYSDPTGSTYTIYTPDQVGTYKVVYTLPQQTMTGYGPGGYGGLESSVNMNARIPGNLASPWINDTYLGSTASTTFTVQQAPVPKPPDYPLPTEFWARPVEGQNTPWSSIASNWLGGSYVYGRLQPNGAAPASAHIMWTKPLELGGVVGGDVAPITGAQVLIPGAMYYSGSSYEGRFTNPIIIGGRLFYPEPLGHYGYGGGYTCVDLLTGETLWHSDALGALIGYTSTGAPSVVPTPSFGQLYDYESQNQHGVVGGILWQVSTVGSGATQNITWSAYDPVTGKWMFNLTGVPPSYTLGNVTQSVQDVYTYKGEIVRYVLHYDIGAQKGWLALWNDTCKGQGLELVDPYNGTGTNAYQWRPNGKSVDMSKAYSWNVSVPALPGVQYDSNYNVIPGYPAIIQVIPGDVILGRSSSFTARAGTVNPYTMWAISDKPETRGQLLWIKNYPAPAGNISRTTLGGTVVDPVNRVFFMDDLETMQIYGYSLDTGEQLWGPVGTDLPAFQYYGTVGVSGQYGYAAYGNLYVQGGYGGQIQCYNAKNGTLLWRFSGINSELNTPWGNYPLFIAAIADGKIYAYTSEHSFNTPIYKGEKVICLDAYTGKELWSIDSVYGVGGFQSGAAPVADGYLAYYNYYDNSIYCIGKGPTAMSLDTPKTAVTAGSTVVLQGSIVDISAGTKQEQQAARFPIGVPAVSDESMSAWMEYVYMQKPKPTNATGVPVKLTAVAPDGTVIDIGTVTSDTDGKFAIMWAPPKEGLYKVTATFEGSNSYYGSHATAYVGVEPAPAASPSVSPSPSASVSPSVSPSIPPAVGAAGVNIYMVAAVIVVIAAAATAAGIIFKRRKK